MECEFRDDCPFFNNRMEDMPTVSEVYKRIYCHGNNDNCARFMIAKRLGASMIPPAILPNNRKMAVRIIEGQMHL